MKRPLIGIIYGSDSDLPKIKEVFDIMDSFGIPYETKIVSAHRTPAEVSKYATTAYARGIKTIIACAGGAAHLPGMIAAETALPVIGVPIASTHLEVASLHSIVQMPPGIPVNTMAINGGVNAGLAAIQMLAISDEKLYKKLIEYKNDLAFIVAEKNKLIEQLGVKEYIKTIR